jgi:hypothetical protein
MHMALSADEYRRAWERRESLTLRYNSHIIPGTCVLETLAMVNNTAMRYVFVDDFGYAVSYCRQRLFEDLVPPDQRGSDASLERWRRMRSAFASDDLAISWAAADAAFSLLLDAFIIQGYTLALSGRLREVVNRYGLDLELGEIYVAPQDVPALLRQIGTPFVWWDDDVERPEQERQSFDFANARHRAILARRLREKNEAN